MKKPNKKKEPIVKTITATEVQRRQADYIKSEKFQAFAKLVTDLNLPERMWLEICARINEPKPKK